MNLVVPSVRHTGGDTGHSQTETFQPPPPRWLRTCVSRTSRDISLTHTRAHTLTTKTLFCQRRCFEIGGKPFGTKSMQICAAHFSKYGQRMPRVERKSHRVTPSRHTWPGQHPHTAGVFVKEDVEDVPVHQWRKATEFL